MSRSLTVLLRRLSTLLARRFSSSFTIIGSSTSALWRMFLVVVLPPPVGPTSITPCLTITWLYSCRTFSTCWGQYWRPRSRTAIEMAFYRNKLHESSTSKDACVCVLLCLYNSTVITAWDVKLCTLIVASQVIIVKHVLCKTQTNTNEYRDMAITLKARPGFKQYMAILGMQRAVGLPKVWRYWMSLLNFIIQYLFHPRQERQWG